MIYVFEGGSVVYDGSTISEEQKSRAVAVEVLPEPEQIDGKNAILKANKAEDTVYYEYVDRPKDSEIEVQKEVISAVGQELAMLKIQLIMGGII